MEINCLHLGLIANYILVLIVFFKKAYILHKLTGVLVFFDVFLQKNINPNGRPYFYNVIFILRLLVKNPNGVSEATYCFLFSQNVRFKVGATAAELVSQETSGA